MKARIKFIKTGSMRFLGHLDVMRYFQKAFRRCGADILYSTGYSPHQLISFASPLGLGMTSEGEYMDAQFASCEDSEHMVPLLNSGMNEEMHVTDFVRVTDNAHPAMSRVSASDYILVPKKTEVFEIFASEEALIQKFQAFLEQPQILIEKKTKKRTSKLDIRPLIYLAGYQKQAKRKEQSGSAALEQKAFSGRDTSIPLEYLLDPDPDQLRIPAPRFVQTAESTCRDCLMNNQSPVCLTHPMDSMEITVPHLFLRLSCGSVVNIKPQQVMEAFFAFCGQPFDPLWFHIHRIELYADLNENPKEDMETRIQREKKLIPLLEDERISED